MTAAQLESVAMSIYWAAWEMMPPGHENPISRMTKESAWAKTSEQHRRLSMLQAQRAVEAMRALGLAT